MTSRQLASLLAKTEGKKHQATVGDVREVIAILKREIKCDLRSGSANIVNLLLPKGYALLDPAAATRRVSIR